MAAAFLLAVAWLDGSLDLASLPLPSPPPASEGRSADANVSPSPRRWRPRARPPRHRRGAARQHPDPVILIDRRSVVIEANPAARALFPNLKLRHPLSFALRAPEILDGIEAVLRTGQPLKTGYATRVPTERSFEVQIGACRCRRRGSAERGAVPARPHLGPAA
ncbi:hypothetical protein [Methylobacterium durans]|uniref:hypothetical protein n=1 Tax=Methylobacterium durans TaxID=2202825 RepID=UPI003AB00183